jgi:hypothetical protein
MNANISLTDRQVRRLLVTGKRQSAENQNPHQYHRQGNGPHGLRITQADR